MAKQARKGGGGQLNRSETVTVRLDPKLNYLCELAARSQRRTKSSLIEAALAEFLNAVPLDPRPTTEEFRPTIAGSAELLWHVNEVDRLQRLAHYASHLMTFDEQKIWATLTRNGYFWEGEWEFYGEDQGMFRPDIQPAKLIIHRAEEYWDTIKSVAADEAPVSALPEAIYYFTWDEKMLDATMAPLQDSSCSDGSEDSA